MWMRHDILALRQAVKTLAGGYLQPGAKGAQSTVAWIGAVGWACSLPLEQSPYVPAG